MENKTSKLGQVFKHIPPLFLSRGRNGSLSSAASRCYYILCATLVTPLSPLPPPSQLR